MGDLDSTDRLPAEAIERPMPWGPVVRGIRIGDGPGVALLLHEPGTDLDAWRELPRWLVRELPLSVVALDLPGHGLSDDPWQPDRLHDFVREVVQFPNPSPTNPPHPPSPLSHCGGRGGTSAPLPSQWERGWGEGERRESAFFADFHFIIAAGATATAALELAGELGINGIVCLSPESPDPQSQLARSPRVPKLIVAGSLAGDDLQTARRLGSQSGGWTVVTSFPVAARGTGLLASGYATQLGEAIAAFLRDCARRPLLARMPPPRGS